MPAFNFYNSLTKAKTPFVAADPTHVTYYSCGPTVYDDAHIGNFRSFLFADLIRRWVESQLCTITDTEGAEHAGPRKVTHVMNLTDVGHMTEDDVADGGGQDKMAQAGQRLLEAKKSGRLPAGAEVDPNDPYAVAGFFGKRFKEDARKLGLKVALLAQQDDSLMPRATDAVPGMIEAIRRLEEIGMAYVVGEFGARTVYFDVKEYGRYGELSGNTLDAIRAGAGGRVDEANTAAKRSPADFLLWKEEPKHLMKWESPWGEGYPGWHIECTVMSLDRLIPGGLKRIFAGPSNDPNAYVLDLHSGGVDNRFPHHECEIAQSCSLTGNKLFARHWAHCAFLTLNGEKISKSKGNFITPRELMDPGGANERFGGVHEPAAVRLELIKAHYRTNADFSVQGLKDSARTIERWRRVIELGDAGDTGEINADVRDAFAARMADDLDVAGAIGVVNKWARGLEQPTKADAGLMRTFDAVLGVLELERHEAQSTGIGVYLPGVEPTEQIEGLLAERAAARKDKDFARADAIRDELSGLGLAIKDVAGGKVEVGRA